MPMPLVKIGYLFIRTIAKPFSSVIKQQAKDHPKFKEVCVRCAQFYHRLDVRMRRRLAARAGEEVVSGSIKPLDEQKAVDLGASFIGEAIIFGVAGILLVADSARSHRAEAARRRIIEDKFEQLFDDVLRLAGRLEEQQEQLQALQQPMGQQLTQNARING